MLKSQLTWALLLVYESLFSTGFVPVCAAEVRFIIKLLFNGLCCDKTNKVCGAKESLDLHTAVFYFVLT